MNDRARIESASETSLTKVRRADFGYSILISIVDLNLGNRSETNDIEHVLRRIEDYYQGSIAGCRPYHVSRSQGVWDGVEWGEEAHFFPLNETKEESARRKLCSR